MGLDRDGSRYRALLEDYALASPEFQSPLMKALHELAKFVGSGLTTESTAAVAYANRRIYVAQLGRASVPTEYVSQIEMLFSVLGAPLAQQMLPENQSWVQLLSVFHGNGAYQVDGIVGVGGGMTGLHAEMMIVKHLGTITTAWGRSTQTNVGIAASQGACPACAGFMNRNGIKHTGVRANGIVSTRWINPVDSTGCGTEVGIGLSFPNRRPTGLNAWKSEW